MSVEVESYDDTTQKFVVFPKKAFYDDATLLPASRNEIISKMGELCHNGVSGDYIKGSLEKDPEMETHGWIGVLGDTHNPDFDVDRDVVGVIVFADMRPEQPRVIRKFICGPGMGSELNALFEQHLVARGQKLDKYEDVTIYLDAINVEKVIASYAKNGYRVSGVVTKDPADPENPEYFTIRMHKTVAIPRSGGRRRRTRTQRVLRTRTRTQRVLRTRRVKKPTPR
jgi:hypothetical protein